MRIATMCSTDSAHSLIGLDRVPILIQRKVYMHIDTFHLRQGGHKRLRILYAAASGKGEHVKQLSQGVRCLERRECVDVTIFKRQCIKTR
jgi:hypothetical protein